MNSSGLLGQPSVLFIVPHREHGSASRVGLSPQGERIFMREEPVQHVTTTEARGGTTPHVTRVVLGVGLALVIVIFAIIFLIGS